MSTPKTILFVPCGGMWNSLTTAVLFALGIRPDQFDEIIGCSSGVPSLAYWMAGQHDEVRESWIYKMTHFRVFHWFKLVFLFSIFRRWGLYAANVDYLIDHCCNDLKRKEVCAHRKLSAIVYDVESATTEFLAICPDNLDAGFKSTTAIPGLSKRIKISNREKVDGGTADPLPIEQLLAYGGEGCRLVVILNHARNYRPTPVKQWQAQCAFPDPQEARAREALLRRHQQHGQSMALLERLEQEGRAYVIAPDFSPPMHGFSRRRGPVRISWEFGKLLGQVHAEPLQSFLQRKS